MTYPPQQPDPWSGQPPYGSGPQPGPYGPDPGGYGGSNGYGPGYGPQDYVEPSAPPDYGQPSAPPAGPQSGPPGYDPYGYQQQPVYQPTQPFPGGPGYGPPPPPPKKGGSPLPWILGGGAALLVVVLVIVLAVVMTGGTKHPPNGKSGSPSASASPSPSVSTDPNKVTDTATGISFTKLGSPWVPTTFKIKEFTETTGEQAQTQTTGNGWYAVICMGPLNTGTFPYSGPSDLQKDTDNMAAAMVSEYYPKNAKTDKKYSDSGGTQNGHQAWVWAYHLSYSQSGVDSTGESVEIALVDLGNGKAGGFYTSVPDTRASDLLPQVKNAVDSLQIAS